MTQLSELKRMQQLAGILKENKLNEAAPNINVVKRNSKDGNKQITINVLGGGWEDNEITLSVEEAKELQKLAKEFLGKRNNKISKGVNTPDKQYTQSIISIEPSGLECIISRKEGSVYKGYDEESGSNTGYLKAAQSIVYAIADEDLSESIKEDATSAPSPVAPAANTKPAAPTAKQTSDVASLTKMISTNTSLVNKLKTVNNGKEVTETLLFILNSINPKVSGVNKTQLKSIIDQRFK